MSETSMSQAQSSSDSESIDNKRQKTDHSDTSIVSETSSNISVATTQEPSSIPSLHLSQGHPVPVATSTPKPDDSDDMSDDPVIQMINTQAEVLATLKENRMRQKKTKRHAAQEMSVKLYEDDEYPPADYDLTTPPILELPPAKFLSVGMVKMSFHMQNLMETYNHMYRAMSVLKGKAAEQEAAGGAQGGAAADEGESLTIGMAGVNTDEQGSVTSILNKPLQEDKEEDEESHV